MTVEKRQTGLVSTIIPVYNRPDLIVEAVNSVLSQTYRPIEIIVVDDGSTDETVSVLESLEQNHPELTVMTQGNSGPGVARELGRQSATGEFIQYLDSDDLLLPEKFALQVDALNAQSDCDIAYGKTESTLIGEPLKGVALKGTGVKILAMFPLFLRSRWWSTSTPLHRAKVLDDVGSWLPLSNEEDWEYDCRIASLGGRLAYVDEFVSNTRGHDEHLSAQGTTDVTKLKDRCIAQQHIYQHAQFYMSKENRLTEITQSDWVFFSKSVFLLARQCAAAGLAKQAKEMMRLSIRVQGCMTINHCFFYLLANLVGWRQASKCIKWMGK